MRRSENARNGCYVHRLKGDERGVAGIEFALIAPILVLLLLGTVEASRALDIDRHFSTATSSTGDAVARQESLGDTQQQATNNLKGLVRAVEHIMAPYGTKDLKYGVFAVQASPSSASDTKVVWSFSHNGMTVPAKCSNYPLPNGVVTKGGSVIVVEAEYPHKTMFGNFVPGFGSIGKFTEKTFHNPRNSCVDYVKSDNCMNPC